MLTFVSHGKTTDFWTLYFHASSKGREKAILEMGAFSDLSPSSRFSELSASSPDLVSTLLLKWQTVTIADICSP